MNFDLNEIFKAICRIECDSETGTGFLVHPDLIITAQHTIQPYIKDNNKVISLEFRNLPEIIKRNALLIDDDEEIDIAILKIEESLKGITPLILSKQQFEYDEEWETWAYPMGKATSGGRMKGTVSAPKVHNTPDVWDIDLYCENPKINEGDDWTAGTSGAPVLVQGKVSGVILRALDQSFGAVNLEKIINILEKNNIPFEKETIPNRYSQGINNFPSTSKTSYSQDIFINTLSTKVNELAESLSGEVGDKLENIRELYKQGKTETAIQKIQDIKKNQDWENYIPSIKAKILFVLAKLVLNESRETTEAKKLLSEIKQIDSEFNTTTLEGLIKYFDKGCEEALRLLEKVENIESFNLRLGLLLELGKNNDVIKEVNNPPSCIMPDAETKRIAAMANLFLGNKKDAQIEIQKALDEKPGWVIIQEIAAIVFYFNAINIAFSDRINLIPYPHHWEYQKEDNESILLLEKAAKIFNILIDNHENESKVLEYKLWHLACLGNNRFKQKEAKEYCIDLLNKNKNNALILFWALVRKYYSDESDIDNIIREIRSTENYTIELIPVLLLYLLKKNNYEEAINILDETRGIFDNQEALEIWTNWRMEALLAANRYEEALEEAKKIESKNASLYFQTIVLHDIHYQDSDLKAYLKHLENVYNETGQDWYFFKICNVKAEQQDWNYIYENSEKLINVFYTPKAFSLAFQAAYNLHKYKYCLELIKKYKNIFHNEELPDHFNSCQIDCREKLGYLNEAVQEAERLAHQKGTTEMIFAYILVLYTKGDFKAIACEARKLKDKEDVPIDNLLWIVTYIASEDNNLAIFFWRRAIKEGAINDPQLLGSALSLGSALNMGDELTPLFRKMNEFAALGKGSFETINIEQVMDLFKQQREHVDKVLNLYRNGKVPVYLISKEIQNCSIIDWFHLIPQENLKMPNPRNQMPIYISYNKLYSAESKTDLTPKNSLYMDVTAILLAWKLDVLQLIESEFETISIPSDALKYLSHESVSLQQNKSHEINNDEKILKLYNEGKLEEIDFSNNIPLNISIPSMNKNWIALLEMAERENGSLIDFLPIRTHTVEFELAEIPKELQNHITDIDSVAEILFQEGYIFKNDKDRIIKQLGKGKFGSMRILPKIGTSLYFPGEIILETVDQKILEKMCNNYKVFLDKSSMDTIKGNVDLFDSNQEAVQWVKDLINHLQQGLEAKKFNLIPAVDKQLIKKELEGELESFEYSIMLSNLLGVNSERDSVIWIEDRFFSKYGNINGIPIIGIVYFLDYLKEKKLIDEEEYYNKLLILRASNFRYISIRKEEIIHHLKQAGIDGNNIIENEGLKILKKYLASCFLDLEGQDSIPMSSEALDQDKDFNFIRESVSEVSNSISETFLIEDIDGKTADLYAYWIFKNLYTSMLGVKHILKNESVTNNNLAIISIDVFYLYMKGLNFFDKEYHSNLQRYHHLLERFFHKRFRSNPEILFEIAKRIKVYIELDKQRVTQESEDNNDFDRYFLQNFFLSLPEFIRNEMDLDTELSKWLGVSSYEPVDIDGEEFDLSSFIKAAADAVNGNKSKLSNRNKQKSFHVERIDPKDNYKLKFYNKYDSTIKIIDVPLLCLVSNNTSEIETFLNSNRFRFDYDKDSYNKLKKELLTIQNPLRRFKFGRKLVDESYQVFINSLRQRVARNSPFTLKEAFPPCADGLTRHFRLNEFKNSNDNFHVLFENAANVLLEEEGVEIAIERISCFPIKIPQKIIDAFVCLSPEKKSNMLSRFYDLWIAPVNLLNLLDLVLYSIEDDEILVLQQKILDKLFCDSGSSYFNLFNSILNWVYGEFLVWPDAKDWTPAIRLAMVWGHSSKIMNLFNLHGLSFEKIVTHLEELENLFKQNQLVNIEIFNKNSDLLSDVSLPHRLDRVTLLIHGIAEILNDKDSDLFENSALKENIQKIAIIKVEENNIPNQKLFADRQSYQNILNSFLKSENKKGLEYLLGADIVKLISVENLQTTIDDKIGALKKDCNNIIHWTMLYIIIRDLPLYPKYIEDFKTILKDVEMSSIFNNNELNAGLHIFIFICTQLGFLNDNKLTERFEKEIIEIARFFNDSKIEDDELKVINATMLEGIIKICYNSNSNEETNNNFNRIIKKVFEVWPSFGKNISDIIFELLNSLPVNQLDELWLILLEIRSRQD